MPLVTCPDCGHEQTVRREMVGLLVDCAGCKSEFRAVGGRAHNLRQREEVADGVTVSPAVVLKSVGLVAGLIVAVGLVGGAAVWMLQTEPGVPPPQAAGASTPAPPVSPPPPTGGPILPAPETAPQPRPAADDRVTGLNREQVVGGVEVPLVSASLLDDSIYFTVVLRGLDESKKYDYRGWGADLLRPAGGKLADDLGNGYRPMQPNVFAEGVLSGGIRDQFGGKVGYGPGAFSADRFRADLLAFERPIGKAGYVDLDLPGSAVGVDGTFRFRIPAEVWLGGKGSPARPKS
jgi:hypothetical protein